MALEKAVIEIDPKDRGGNLPDRITVQFNPAEYTLAKGAQIAEIAIPGIDSPVLQFVRGQNEKLTFELFFDTTQSGMGEDQAQDVRELTNPFYQLVKIQSNTHAPPRIRFIWGKGLAFKAIVESVQQKFTLFNPSGVPLRASLSVSFREYKTLEEQLQEMNLQSSDHSKRRVIRRGDTLNHIAYEEYGDPGLWRVIAEAKDNAAVLSNPLKLTPGTEIAIPALDIFGNPQVNG